MIHVGDQALSCINDVGNKSVREPGPTIIRSGRFAHELPVVNHAEAILAIDRLTLSVAHFDHSLSCGRPVEKLPLNATGKATKKPTALAMGFGNL